MYIEDFFQKRLNAMSDCWERSWFN